MVMIAGCHTHVVILILYHSTFAKNLTLFQLYHISYTAYPRDITLNLTTLIKTPGLNVPGYTLQLF